MPLPTPQSGGLHPTGTLHRNDPTGLALGPASLSYTLPSTCPVSMVIEQLLFSELLLRARQWAY